MVLFDMLIYSLCEGINTIFLPSQGNEWHFIVKCTSCQETFPHEIYFNDVDKVEVKGEASFANFAAKCKSCDRHCNLSVHKESPRSVTVAENGRTKDVIASFECRGLELVKFIPGNTLSVTTVSGKTFENIDISDLWVEYDDSTQENVQVDEIKFEFVRRK